MNQLRELRKLGYKVRIRHVREFIGIKRSDDDCFMTRGEYEYCRLNGHLDFSDVFSSLYYADKYGADTNLIPAYSIAVNSLGGWTEVDIETPYGEIGNGKFNFNNRPFNRKIGLKAAFGRALKKMKSEKFVAEDVASV